jgi:phage terminase large subunit-like protein
VEGTHNYFIGTVLNHNSGKSHAAAVQLAWDATGLYPDWYKGPKTSRGINAWVVGDTTENVRDAPQRKLFGPDKNRPGWTDKPGREALIHHKYIMGKPSMKSVAGAIDTVWVKHVPSDTTSVISFKTHGMDQQALASWTGDRVWVDEECPKEIMDELIARISVNNGFIYYALCPQHGITPLVKWIRDNAGGPHVLRVYLSYDDAKHLDPEVKARNRALWASDPAMLAARSEGRETSNSGLIFPFPLDSVLYDPRKIAISPHWRYLGGLDVGWRHPTAATAAAWDPLSDVVYVYASYEQAEKDYEYHYRNLQKWGPSMSFMIDPASDQASQADGTKILEKYWDLAHGPNWDEIEEEKRKFIKANNSFPTGMDTMWHRFQTQRLLISQNLKTLHDQYSGYEWNKDGDGPMRETPIRRYDVITSLRYLTMGLADYAHRLDAVPPWQETEWQEPVEEHPWVPYRAGRNSD